MAKSAPKNVPGKAAAAGKDAAAKKAPTKATPAKSVPTKAAPAKKVTKAATPTPAKASKSTSRSPARPIVIAPIGSTGTIARVLH